MFYKSVSFSLTRSALDNLIDLFFMILDKYANLCAEKREA